MTILCNAPIQDSTARTVKPSVSLEVRQQVLEFRRSHSLSKVAERTGLPLGTVKTICSRSGAFRDNQKLRALFCLPPIRQSKQTALTVPELPPKNAVTGDDEIDAVLWLREVIGTGQAALIEKAMEAAKKIKTPLAELEKRYVKHLVSLSNGNVFGAVLGSLGFADLGGLGESSIRKLTLSNEATARFGDVHNLFADTEAEQFCIKALAGMKIKKGGWCLDESKVSQRFMARPDCMPNTLSDCLYELAFWHDLYSLRNATGGCGDSGQEAGAREDFSFRLLAEIRPRSKEEAIAVFRYLVDRERMDESETEAILLNLIG